MINKTAAELVKLVPLQVIHVRRSGVCFLRCDIHVYNKAADMMESVS